MDTGREGVGTGNVYCPDGTHSRGGHPDAPWAGSLDAGTVDAGRKERLASKRDQSWGNPQHLGNKQTVCRLYKKQQLLFCLWRPVPSAAPQMCSPGEWLFHLAQDNPGLFPLFPNPL